MLRRQIADEANAANSPSNAPLRRNRAELRAAGRKAAGLMLVKHLTTRRTGGRHAQESSDAPEVAEASKVKPPQLPSQPETSDQSERAELPAAQTPPINFETADADGHDAFDEIDAYDEIDADIAALFGASESAALPREPEAEPDTQPEQALPSLLEPLPHADAHAEMHAGTESTLHPSPVAILDHEGPFEQQLAAQLEQETVPETDQSAAPVTAELTDYSLPEVTSSDATDDSADEPSDETADAVAVETAVEAEAHDQADDQADHPVADPVSGAVPAPEALDLSAVSMRLAQQAQLPAVDLSEYPVQADAVALVPEHICRRSRLIPITRHEGRLMVAMVDPSDVVAIDDVSRRTGLTVVPLVADARSVSQAIDRYHRVDSELAELSTTIATEASEFLREQGGLDDDALDGDDDAPIIRFVNLLISQAIMDHASDIHIEPRRGGLHVRYRIDGVLHDVQQASRTMVAGVISRLKVMANLDIAERRRPQDGRISISQAGRSVDLRVATLPTVWGEKIVMRILDTQASSRTLGDLTMSDRNLDIFRTSFSKPHGMVLVTGPTGSGKSTTLYTALGEVSTTAVNVITIEDPVEYRMEGVNQVQVNTKAGLTFASALRSILRSDPDVVLLGEIRDRETAQIAIEASLTGHLVLSTLHTNNAASAVTRLVEMGIEPFLVGSAVECVVAQRLARRLCVKCREQIELDEDRLAALQYQPADADEPPTFWRPVGCYSCSNTGYAGRLAVHEVLHVDEQIERLAVGEASAGEIAAYALSQGMVTLRQDGLAKAAAGLTSIDEVLRVTA